jgi:hypothetical protein
VVIAGLKEGVLDIVGVGFEGVGYVIYALDSEKRY